MKLRTYSLALVASLSFLAACSSPTQNARLAAVGDLALAYSLNKGVISPEDAQLAMKAGKILLTPYPGEALPQPESLPVTASK